MSLLYTLAIGLLRFLYFVVGYFDAKANAFVSGRRNFFKRFQKAFAQENEPVVWVHCASLGEFEQGRPVIEKIKAEFPKHKILLTFFSPSGYEVRKNYTKADYIFYLPWDTQKNAVQFIDIANPILVIFVKYEFWNFYTQELKKRNIPLISISAIFRTQQLFFKSYGEFYRNMLKNFSWFFVQNDESVRLLKEINIKNVSRAGDTRFDRVNQLVKQDNEIPIAKNFKGMEKVMVVGSCWREDLDVLIPFINEHYFSLKFIIAPHEVTEAFLSEIEGALNTKSIRYSQAMGNLEDYHVLIIDNVGMLGRLYRYGEFAYVGGAFGKGLHNILEAACYGIPVFFGNKNYEKFQEAIDLINRGGAFELGDYRDMKAKYESVNVPENFLLACDVTRLYVEENLGATEKIMDYCRPLLVKV
ncbi:MAG: 3-deoxy-D-manno-octulosonic acid transferase [Cyclobacteriaceae bacterium]|nr:3-deoxy-D-manno-octulosonic acid transferase [Cyclobacteriaceae bacterium]